MIDWSRVAARVIVWIGFFLLLWTGMYILGLQAAQTFETGLGQGVGLALIMAAGRLLERLLETV